MPAPDLPFTAAEYDRRLSLARARMDALGLDAVFIEDPSNMAWLTGYDGWSFYVHQGVILRPAGEPLWWGRNMDAAGARRLFDGPDRGPAAAEERKPVAATRSRPTPSPRWSVMPGASTRVRSRPKKRTGTAKSPASTARAR